MSTRSQETLVDDQFAPRAAAYVASPVHALGEDLNSLGELIGHRPEAVALDLGCGGGHVSFRLAPRVKQIIAYDLSAAMVDVTRREARTRGLANLEVHQGVAEKLPYPDDSVDIVVSRYSVHHWHDAAAGLREARRVMKPGGLAIFMDVFAPGVALLDTWLQSLELLRDPSHVRDYTLAQWHALLEAAGFGPAATRRYRVTLEFRSWVERMNAPAHSVTAIRALQSIAPEDVLRYFEVQRDGTFTVDSMLMQMTG
jgi:ubiquinone/menaquinone biosynthesis C-methylase UbiE